MSPSRVMPHASEYEHAICATVMLDADSIGVVSTQLVPDDFYVERFRLVYEAQSRIYARGEPIDTLTVRRELEAMGALARVTDEGLFEITNKLPEADHVETYAQAVAGLGAVRRTIAACLRAGERGFQVRGEHREYLDETEAAVLKAAELARTGARGLRSMHEVMISTAEAFRALHASGKQIVGLSTGIRDLDAMLHGLKPGELVIVAGRPGTGKSALAGHLAKHTSEAGGQCVVASLEMTQEQWAQRMVTADARVAGDVFRGKLPGGNEDRQRETMARVMGSMASVAALPVWIDDTPAATVLALRANCRRVKNRHGLALVVVDYLQLMRSGMRHHSREEEVAEISRSLKALAKELDVPVVALAQLNRESEKRGDKRPTVADLRESGQIEQDADVVLLLYRDEIYNPDSQDRNRAEIIIGKQRAGATGKVHVAFFPEYSAFYDLSRDEEPGRSTLYDDVPRETADVDPREFQD